MVTALLLTILGCVAIWFGVFATTGTGDITFELTAWGTATSHFDGDTVGNGQVQTRVFSEVLAHKQDDISEDEARRRSR